MGDINNDKDSALPTQSMVCSSVNESMSFMDCRGESDLSKSNGCVQEECTSEPASFSARNSRELLGESSLSNLVKSSLRVARKPPVSVIYRQDIVHSSTQEGVYGMVTKIAGDSDSDSGGSDADGEDEDESILEGHARIIWTNLEETTEKIEDVAVADRGFLHGDIVAAVSDPLGQIGTVVNVDLRVDLKTPDGEIKTNIPSRKLRRIRAFAEGDYVLNGPWLGRVVEVVDNVTVLFDDGSKCKIMRADPERLMPVSRNLLEDAHYPYHPGQRVRGSSSVVFKNSKWLRGTWKACRMEGTVTNVEVGSIYVYWIAAANPGSSSQSTSIPADIQDPKQLKLLSCFSHANWQLGDWCLLPNFGRKNLEIDASAIESVVLDADTGVPVENATSSALDSGVPTVLGSKFPMHENWVTHRKKFRRRRVKRDKKAHKKEDSLEWALFVVNTRTKVDVLWQDGTRSFGVDSSTLFPVDNLGDHDFWPEQYVLEKGSDEEYFDSKRVGVVKTVNSKDRTARVRWLKPVVRIEDPREFDKEEVVSVYELAEHPDYNYCIGDIVIRLSPVTEALEVSGIENPSADDKDCKSNLERGTKTTEAYSGQRVLRKQEAVENQSADDIECKSKPESDARIREQYLEQGTSGKQKAKVGVSFEDQSGDDKEFENKPKCEIDTRTVEFSSDRKSSKKRRKARVGVSIEESDLSWIGNITGLQDGDIEVVWADGTTSKVGPQEIFVVGRDDEVVSNQSSFEDDDNDDAASWETVDFDTMDALDLEEQNEQVEHVVKSAGDQTATDSDQKMGNAESAAHSDEQCSDGGRSIPRAAFGFVARLATGLLGFRGSQSISDTVDSASQGQAAQKDDLEENLDTNEMGKIEEEEVTNDSQCHVPEHSDNSLSMQDGLVSVPSELEGEELRSELECDHQYEEIIEGVQERMEAPSVGDLGEFTSGNAAMEQTEDTVLSSDNPRYFKHFDIVKDPVDHYHLNETGQKSNDRKWTKKVHQEWSILEKNLPETIYVRIYEDRIDLLRAVIIGASGTPYQDGLFFFDIYLPPEYPQTPPSVLYHSHGLKLNPNLYETGKICLSLLNTWTGRGNEVWDPTTSSILQVLVSLQGLVLNARPYFNEAGYDKQIGKAEGEKNSLAYNEHSFLLSCKLMLYLLHRPPKHFETFVKDHFRNRARFILSACDAYMKGAEVGSLSEVPSNFGSDYQNNSSVGFQLMLAKLIPKLESAFRELDSDGLQCTQSIFKESSKDNIA